MARKARQKDANGNDIPRPMNCFMLYSLDMRPMFQGDATNKAQLIGQSWKRAPDHVKAHYRGLAEVEKINHAKKYPDYQYHPQEKQVSQGRTRAKRQPKNQPEAEASIGAPMAMGSTGGQWMGIAQSAMPLASLPYPLIPAPYANAPSPSTASSPNSSGPDTPRNISPAIPFMPFQSIVQAPISDAIGYPVTTGYPVIGKGKEMATVPIYYNHQGTTTTLPFQTGQFIPVAYNNNSTASIFRPFPATFQPVPVDTVVTSDISAFGATYEGATGMPGQEQPIEGVNREGPTAGNVPVDDSGSAQDVHSLFVPVVSSKPLGSIDNTAVSNSTASIDLSTPSPTELLAAHYATHEATAGTVSNGTSDTNSVNAGVQNVQPLPVRPSSLPPSAFMNNFVVSNSSATVNYPIVSPTQLLSTYYANPGGAVQVVANNKSGNINVVTTSPQDSTVTFDPYRFATPATTASVNSIDRSVLIGNPDASSFSATRKSVAPPTSAGVNSINRSVSIGNWGASASSSSVTVNPAATVHSSILNPTSFSAPYNLVPQAPSNQAVEQPNDFCHGLTMKEAADALLYNWFRQGGTEEGLDNQIEQLFNQANVEGAQSGGAAHAA